MMKKKICRKREKLVGGTICSVGVVLDEYCQLGTNGSREDVMAIFKKQT
jgi:hypothetical protein